MIMSVCAPALSILVGTLALLTTACTSDRAARLAAIEQRFETMALEHQLLPQQMETFRIKLDALDQEVRSRQSRIVAEIAHFRSEDLVHLTQRIEALTESFQQFRREMTSDAATNGGTETPNLEEQIARIKRAVEKLQLQQEQAFAAETAWLAALAGQLESARTRVGRAGVSGRPAQSPP